jgi:hypothetical protein
LNEDEGKKIVWSATIFFFSFLSTKEIEKSFFITNSILLYLPTPTASSVFNEARFSCVCRFAVADEHPRLSSFELLHKTLPFFALPF